MARQDVSVGKRIRKSNQKPCSAWGHTVSMAAHRACRSGQGSSHRDKTVFSVLSH